MFCRSAIFMIWRMGEGRLICSRTRDESAGLATVFMNLPIVNGSGTLTWRFDAISANPLAGGTVKSAMFEALRQDVTHAVRGLLKSPGFAAAALITLALGIGATSAIFSVVKAVLITPLPYSSPERTVRIFTRWTAFDKTWIADQEVIDF